MQHLTRMRDKLKNSVITYYWFRKDPANPPSMRSLCPPSLEGLCRQVLRMKEIDGDADRAVDYLMRTLAKAPNFPPPGFTEEEFAGVVEMMVREIVHAPHPVFNEHLRLRWDRAKRKMVHAETGEPVDWRRRPTASSALAGSS